MHLRYSGQDLGDTPHIVVLGSCKVGNFVVSIPVLTALRVRYPKAVIGFVGSIITTDFERELPSLTWNCSWDQMSQWAGFNLHSLLVEKRKLHGEISLAINLDGFNPFTCSLMPHLYSKYVAGGTLTADCRSMLDWGSEPRQAFLKDSDWDSIDFLERYHGFFDSNYISELFCQLAYVKEYAVFTSIDLPSEPPKFDVPDILIHCTTARDAKIWPFDYWRQVVDFIRVHGWTVGLIGSSPKQQRALYNSGNNEEWLLSSSDLIDLRGATTLLQLAGACRQAKAVITVDAGPLHIAAAVGTPTLAVVGNDPDSVGASPIRLWMPRSPNVTRTVSNHSCDQCALNAYKNNSCFFDDHPCMNHVLPNQVIDWIISIM